MSYCKQTDGNLAALEHYMNTTMKAEARHEHAQEMARTELYTDSHMFRDAISDIGDTLFYAPFPKGKQDFAELQKKKLVESAILAMQKMAADAHYGNVQTPCEKALGELLNFEAEYWLGNRTEHHEMDIAGPEPDADYLREKDIDDRLTENE